MTKYQLETISELMHMAKYSTRKDTEWQADNCRAAGIGEDVIAETIEAGKAQRNEWSREWEPQHDPFDDIPESVLSIHRAMGWDTI